MARRPFEVQTIGSAFAGKIPEPLWRTVSRHETGTAAYKAAQKWRKWYTPQPGSWSGHVRVLRDGKHVGLEDNGLSAYEVEP